MVDQTPPHVPLVVVWDLTRFLTRFPPTAAKAAG